MLLKSLSGRPDGTDGKSIGVTVPGRLQNMMDGEIIVHSTGREEIHYMKEKPEVRFEVDEMEDMMNWRSVIAWGNYEEITMNWINRNGWT